MKIISPTCLIFVANYVLNFSQYSGDTFILTPRYTNENFSEILGKGDYFPVNGQVLIDAYADDMVEAQLKGRSKFVIIGSIRRVG